MPKTARNAEYTKEYNRKTVLKLLRIAPMSRSAIAREMGLTRATLSLIAEKLITDGIIREDAAGEAHQGRTPVPLYLCPDAYYTIGVYLNRKSCRVALVNINEDILLKKSVNIDEHNESLKITLLADCIRSIIAESEVPREKIIGIGVSCPGPIDSKNGRILHPPYFDIWHHTDICSLLNRMLDLPVYLENDASCLAIYHLGKPSVKGSKNFLLLLEDNGLGSGIIVNGKIIKGNGGFTGELGHTSICYDGEKCSCGNYGCLEGYAAIKNLLKDTAYTSWADVIDRIHFDNEALAIAKKEARFLSTGIINAANFIGIDTVLLAGNLSHGAEIFSPMIEVLVNECTLHRDRMNIRVLPSSCHDDIQVLAAADVAFNNFLSV